VQRTGTNQEEKMNTIQTVWRRHTIKTNTPKLQNYHRKSVYW